MSAGRDRNQNDQAMPTTKTVLLIEDNEDNRIVYSTLLRHYGYRCVEAVDGREGADAAQADPPDLILCDISLPGIDGYEVARTLKANEATKRIPVLALTAHALPDDRENAMRAGFDGYLAKPIEPLRVLAEVRRILGDEAERPRQAGA